MPQSKWRQLTVDGLGYEWFLQGNEAFTGGKFIRVRRRGTSGPMLFLNPYDWHLDIRPRTICAAIRWALAEGWDPAQRNQPPVKIRCDEQGFYRDDR